jgi:hypothetical protein
MRRTIQPNKFSSALMSISFATAALLLGAITLTSGTSSAATKRWIKSGGPERGNIVALGINPKNSTTVYAGTYGGGVFRLVSGNELIPPEKATLISPSGTISTPTPTYTWNAVSSATWYLLWANDGSVSPRIQQWYTDAQAGCATGTGACSVTPSVALASGAAMWWIQTWNDAGYGPWSDGMPIVVTTGNVPGKAILRSPSGSIQTDKPVYTWNAESSATWYLLWVNDASASPRIQQWYTDAQAGCATGTGTCSVTPSVALASGAAMWWIQTWNDTGYGPWSDGMPFVVTTGNVPGKAILISPSGSIQTDKPAYTWNAVSSATWYLLWVNDASASPRIQQWYTDAQAGCGTGTGTCSVTPSVAVASGAAMWWIQTWNNVGYGQWSAGMGFDFRIGCPLLNGTEVLHMNDVTTSETWAGDGTVHHVVSGLTVRPGASLTLSPCAVVKVSLGQVLTVSGTPAQPAKLVSKGTVDQPVLITNAIAGQKWGGWRNLTPNSTFELSYTTLENGGNGGTHGASLDLRANGLPQSEAIPVLKADHLMIKNSVGTGLVMASAAAFTADSTELTVTGSGGTITGGDYAIEVGPIAAGTLPKLNVLGNAHDAIRVSAGSLYISRDLTLKNLGVPYYFYFDRVRITDLAGGTTPTLTIQPGVELRFDDYLVVGYINPGISSQPGRLIAVGTPSQPIVFTSSKSSRVAGDWPGIWLLNAGGSRLENVRIEYAGGANGISSSNCKPVGTSDNAALFIGFKNDPYVPAASDFVSVEISHSRSHGINAMWESGGFGPDLTAGFTFHTIGGCRQTKNGTPTGCGTGAGCLVP